MEAVKWLEDEVSITSWQGDFIESSDPNNPNLYHDYFPIAKGIVQKDKFYNAKILVRPQRETTQDLLDELGEDVVFQNKMRYIVQLCFNKALLAKQW